jgi:uncharacterized membrane protein
VTYTAGVDDPDEIRQRILEAFPRCYDCDLVEANRASTRPDRVSAERRGLRDTVMGYLKANLDGQAIAEAVYSEADELIGEVRP